MSCAPDQSLSRASRTASGKDLQDELTGLKSYRIGTFRIIYRLVEKHHIEVVAIGPRKNIYQETYRIICRDN
jgi:mRNA-degrading endonuclease RelE of RelBE toxin-antitoxin system